MVRYKNKNLPTHPLYYVFRGMKQRCLYKGYKEYSLYGGRGIKVCDRWLNFDNFVEDMLIGYKKGLQLDRVDNDKGYFKENCRWATPKENASNRRSTRWIEYNGERKTLTQWAEKVGLDSRSLWQRMDVLGWPFEKCLYFKNPQS